MENEQLELVVVVECEKNIKGRTMLACEIFKKGFCYYTNKIE